MVTANIVFLTHGTILALYEFQTSLLQLVQSERVVLPLRTMSVYSEDCHCGQSGGQWGETHMCDVAIGLLCVFPRDLFGLLNTETAFPASSKHGIAWSLLMNGVKTALRRARLFAKTQRRSIFTITLCYVHTACVCVLRWLAATDGCFFAWTL